MSNGRVCCILGVCCSAGSEEQRAALAEALQAAPADAEGGIGERSVVRRSADWIIDNFDLAPKGSLTQLKSEIAQMAKKH